eukprot:scaffold7523_cov132-Isochrysis_galbana.AAC.7
MNRRMQHDSKIAVMLGERGVKPNVQYRGKLAASAQTAVTLACSSRHQPGVSAKAMAMYAATLR